jgi:hypothetical protein
MSKQDPRYIPENGYVENQVYEAIFPAWSRWLLPVGYIGYRLLFGALAVVFWQVSIQAEKWRAVWFSLLGGLGARLGYGIESSLGLF